MEYCWLLGDDIWQPRQLVFPSSADWASSQDDGVAQSMREKYSSCVDLGWESLQTRVGSCIGTDLPNVKTDVSYPRYIPLDCQFGEYSGWTPRAVPRHASWPRSASVAAVGKQRLNSTSVAAFPSQDVCTNWISAHSSFVTCALIAAQTRSLTWATRHRWYSLLSTTSESKLLTKWWWCFHVARANLLFQHWWGRCAGTGTLTVRNVWFRTVAVT